MAVFEFSQIQKWLSPKESSPFPGIVRGFQHNSSEVKPGDLFFAIKGERVDGHQFLEEVARKQAAGAVISKGYQGDRFGLACIEVDDVLIALQNLAKIAHAQRNVRVIGVTGSVGKTTTKEFIATLLEGAFRVGKTPGNANSQIGFPLSILNAEGDEEIFVMEMGMSMPGEIARLVEIAFPEIAVVTKIALAHAAFFSNGLEGIAAAKAEILSHPFTKIAVINSQATQFSSLAELRNGKRITYCMESDLGEEGCPGIPDVVLYKREEGFYIREGSEESPRFHLPFSATHLCENFLGAAVVARSLGMQWSQIIEQAQKLRVYKKRFERIDCQGVTFINDSYNANPTSMRAALKNMPSPNRDGKRIAVLGAMKELGPFTEHGHLEVGQVALGKVDYLICFGEECQPMVDLFRAHERPVESLLDIVDVKQRVKELAKPGDVVLLKGSNSKQLWRVLEEFGE